MHSEYTELSKYEDACAMRLDILKSFEAMDAVSYVCLFTIKMRIDFIHFSITLMMLF